MISLLRNVFTADVHIRPTSLQPPCGLCSYGHTNHFAFLDMLHTYSFGQGFYMIQDAYTRRIHILLLQPLGPKEFGHFPCQP